jgi:pyruvate dehydrogenase E2 component (dihydrolipoamide acetyltransferase)
LTAPIPDETAAQLESLGIRRGTYSLKPVPRIQKVIASRLTEAARDIPTFPLTTDLSIDRLLAVRSDYNNGAETKVSVNDLLVKACALTLRDVPAVNASFTPLGIVTHNDVDVSVAVATDGGLVTPIVRSADTRNVSEIATDMRDLAARARIGRLQPDEYVGGTFTISNLGMFGIRSFGSIINPPQSAILSVGSGEQRAVVRDGALVVETIMTVTLTCDHRIIDGATGARWLQALRERVGDPGQLVA